MIVELLLVLHVWAYHFASAEGPFEPRVSKPVMVAAVVGTLVCLGVTVWAGR